MLYFLVSKLMYLSVLMFYLLLYAVYSRNLKVSSYHCHGTLLLLSFPCSAAGLFLVALILDVAFSPK